LNIKTPRGFENLAAFFFMRHIQLFSEVENGVTKKICGCIEQPQIDWGITNQVKPKCL